MDDGVEPLEGVPVVEDDLGQPRSIEAAILHHCRAELGDNGFEALRARQDHGARPLVRVDDAGTELAQEVAHSALPGADAAAQSDQFHLGINRILS